MQGDGEMDHLERPSPLTDKERVMIQDSWAKVYENCDDAGVAILVRHNEAADKDVPYTRSNGDTDGKT